MSELGSLPPTNVGVGGAGNEGEKFEDRN